ncbi:MAG: Glu/Leu/Phe/Val dehydrogenase [Bdellovibrionales bacterium]
MSVFDVIQKHGDHEEVIFCHNKEVGLKAIIAIHNTALGPALGGTRMWNYKSDDEALVDVLRLSRGMTYKASAAGLNLGGGKAVIIGDPKTHKSEGLFRAFGQFVNSLNGRYITAEDVGTSVKDMEHVLMETPWVTGTSSALGGSGDPSPFTAQGTLIGMKACAKTKFGSESLKGLKVAVQGLGHVGYHLVSLLQREKAVITVADIDKEKMNSVVTQFGANACSTEEIVATDCDIFAPCAMGAVINDQTINKLRCKIIAGAANNQLAEPKHGDMLKELGILYAPDFVINAGGLVNVWVELEGYSKERSMEIVNKIYDNLMNIFQIAESERVSTNTAAHVMAQRRIDTIGRLKQNHQGRATRPFSNLKVQNR